MYALCLECFTVLNPNVYDEKEEYNTCPIMGCNGELVLVDENIIPVLILLNSKGYKTQFCCSSHIWNDDMYISFVPGTTFESIPDGFKLEVINNTDDFIKSIEAFDKESDITQDDITPMVTLRRISLEESLFVPDKYVHIFEGIFTLLQWAQKLPNCQNISDKGDDI